MSCHGRRDDERSKSEDGTLLRKNAPAKLRKHNKPYIPALADIHVISKIVLNARAISLLAISIASALLFNRSAYNIA